MIVYITIGNSDDKLSQHRWSRLIHCIDEYIAEIRANDPRTNLFGRWFSAPDTAFQNAVWCVNLHDERYLDSLKRLLRWAAGEFGQDSIALAQATTELLTPIYPSGQPRTESTP